MTIHVLSLSYGKDSIACLEACKLLGYPIDRVIHAEVWATDTIPAELPPMIEFKVKADKIIKERYGLTVEHIAAERERERDCHSLNSSIPYTQKGRTKEESMVSQCKEGFGVIQGSNSNRSVLSYERMFYTVPKKRKDPQYEGKPIGFPLQRKPWCNSHLKVNVLTKMAFPKAPSHKELTQILCNTSELRLMNQNALSDTKVKSASFYH